MTPSTNKKPLHDKPEAVRSRMQRKNQRDRELLGIVPVTILIPEADRADLLDEARRRRMRQLKAVIADPQASTEARSLAEDRLESMKKEISL